MNYKEATKVLGGLLDAFDRDEHGDYFYEHGWEVCEATILAHGALQNQPFWIPVEERLPRRFERVLVWDEEEDAVGEAEYNGEDFKWVKDENIAFATHWMPLPEPPKEEV